MLIIVRLVILVLMYDDEDSAWINAPAPTGIAGYRKVLEVIG